MTHRISTIVVLTFLGIGTPACRHKHQEPPSDAPAPTAARESDDDYDDDDNAPSDVHLDVKLAKMCDIPTPNFAFDSANIEGDAQQALDKLAECVTNGAAKDENLRLVGHADPRGDEEYNFALGQRRASTIAGYLREKGVGADRVETSSRGELDATGTDEQTFARDRRVDILLAG